jgi:hypothetical protein
MSELLKVNVNEHTEKKGGLTYLSWAWAWAEVLKADPRATWTAHTFGGPGAEEPFMRLPGDTAMVHTSVTINGLRRDCLLPVMDNPNNAVKNPDARKVSDAIMRCMTKAIAMHGLGLYIYAGEDLPEGAPEPTPEEALVPVLAASIEQARQKRQGVMGAVLADIHLDAATELGLAKLAKEVAGLPPDLGYDRIEMEELNGDEKTWLWSLLDSKVRSALKREKDTRALMTAATKETTHV